METKQAKTPKPRIPVVCMECGKKFSTTNALPECPKCGGVDIEVR